MWIDKHVSDADKVIITGGATVCTQPESKAQIIYTITSKGMEIDLQFYPDASLPENSLKYRYFLNFRRILKILHILVTDLKKIILIDAMHLKSDYIIQL